MKRTKFFSDKKLLKFAKKNGLKVIFVKLSENERLKT